MTKPPPDLSLLDDVVAEKVLHAMRIASARLSALGVRHALVGGLAVGAHGYPRATRDVDFLVGEEAFEKHAGGIVTMKPGVPIEVGGVAIDFLSAKIGEEHLIASLGASLGDGAKATPVASPGALIYLKLKSPRQKDRADIIELVKAGIDLDTVRSYLGKNAPTLLTRFEQEVAAAEAESA